MNSKEELINAIKQTLRAKKVTLSDLASQMTGKNKEKGITQASLSQTINGNPSLDKLVEIANILECTVPELLSGGCLAEVPETVSTVINGQEYHYNLSK